MYENASDYYLNLCENKAILDPENLLYLTQKIIELDYIENSTRTEVLVALFELNMIYSALFMRDNYGGSQVAVDLLQQASNIVNSFVADITAFKGKEDLFKRTFVDSKYLKMYQDYFEKEEEREFNRPGAKIYLELSWSIVELIQKVNDELFTVDVTKHQNQKILDMYKDFRMIRDGTSFQ
jgi:hypothetical protein